MAALASKATVVCTEITVQEIQEMYTLNHRKSNSKDENRL
ncbi:Protein of unknown function [Bacillus cereus]|nr:Protein of unknown function [Bacillus cereus]